MKRMIGKKNTGNNKMIIIIIYNIML